ncbi:hypothetical protein LB504_012426 [Fusarium proliferatum]|nr:hypothetical protein LB504_012426 [Fusarium proliferatum]
MASQRKEKAPDYKYLHYIEPTFNASFFDDPFMIHKQFSGGGGGGPA